MELGSTFGNPSINVSQAEFLHEATDVFSKPIIERDLLDGGEVFYHPISTISDDRYAHQSIFSLLHSNIH